MSKIIDISAKLTNERPKIKVAEGKEFEVDDRKNTVIKMNQMIKSDSDVNDVEFIDSMLELLLGKKAVKEIEALDLPFSQYKILMIAVMAAVSGEEYETAESRFQKEAEV